jgi:hypothetical protein
MNANSPADLPNSNVNFRGKQVPQKADQRVLESGATRIGDNRSQSALVRKPRATAHATMAALLGIWALSAVLVACSDDDKAPPVEDSELDAGTSECIDSDGDGFGKGCRRGSDCDDQNPDVTTGCYRCIHPETEGCACQDGTVPAVCFLDSKKTDAGTTVCSEGTRYCRDGKWTGCESVRTYVAPGSSMAKIIDPDAGHVNCDVCYVNCYRVTDEMDPVDGGLDAAICDRGKVVWGDAGGITLARDEGDGGIGDAGGEPPPCVVGADPTDMDCDGIPDQYDPYPNTKPFQTDNQALFFQLGPGQTGTGSLGLEFYLKTADIYFLLDQTGSMAEERENLHAALTSGTFLGSTVECADIDFDGTPNNELKSQGIIGAIRCMIRDAWFGAGFHREIPFSPHGDSTEITFRNYQDISGNVDATREAINRMTNNSNSDWPEGHSQALWSVATGGGLFMGYNRAGVPPRTNCPSETWGYPCFRDDAVPIIILFTDAMFHNGPNTGSVSPGSTGYEYNASYSITKGTTAAYVTVPNTNEDFSHIYDLGDVTSSFVTYMGDTWPMNADVPASTVSCNANSSAPDAVFQFSLASTKTVTINTVGSDFDTVLSLHSGTPTSAPSAQAVSGNETQTTAQNAGDIYNNWFVGTGSTASMNADYQGSAIGCSAASAGKDAVYAFSLSQPTSVSIDTVGSSFDTVLSLHSGAFSVAPSATAISNTNDTQASAYSVGSLNGQYVAFTGTTNAAGITANYSNALIGCNADSSSPDAVYNFSLAQATRIRLDTEDSSFDTVLSLHNGTIPAAIVTTSTNTNETIASALSLGDAYSQWFTVNGNTASMSHDYLGSYVGCNAGDNAPDAVVGFTVSQNATPLQIDTLGSAYDTVISLHKVGTYTRNQTITETAITNENHTLTTGAFDLGDLYKSYLDVTGPSIAAANRDYLGTIIGCGADSTKADIAFKFTLSHATNVRISGSNSAFDNVISLHDDAIPMGTAVAVSGNEKESNAYDVGTINGNVKTFTGSTSTMTADITNVFSNCIPDNTAPDAVFKFTVASNNTTVQIDTIGSSFDTIINLYKTSIASNNQKACDDNSGGGTTSLISQSLNSGTYYVVVKGKTSTNKGAYVLTVKNTSVSNNEIACSNDTGNNSEIQTTTALAAGTYYVVLKGAFGSSPSTYRLILQDSDATAVSYLSCNDDISGSEDSSRITTTLDIGTYEVVVKGYQSRSGNYTLNIRDTAHTGANQVTCDDSSGTNSSSIIERDLAAGNYSVVVKGNAATDKGTYKLTMRDVTNRPVNQQSCNDDSSGTASAITANLAAGDYYAVVKSKGSSVSGNYQLSIKDATHEGDLRLTCNDNASTSVTTAKISTSLTAGTYYLVLKGKTATASGVYNLSVGAGTTSTGTFVPKSWTETRDALVNKGIKVMTVLSCQNDPTNGNASGDCNRVRDQAKTIATLTGTLGTSNEPLVFDINSDGTGLSTTVVDGVKKLADYMTMDVSVGVVWSPDTNPGFLFSAQAIDVAGDGCDPPVGVEHQNCLPGAVPHFKVSFTNPINNPIPPNPNDPNGGYNFKVNLIGDGIYVLDSVPVYIIPEEPPSRFVESATYWQDVQGTACKGNDRPDWSDLTWSADLPSSTKIRFEACAAETSAGLAACTYQTVALVSASGACTSSSDCSATGGTCNAHHVCETITSSSCTTNDQCPLAATCISGSCTYAAMPADVAAALGWNNRVPYVRVRITLQASSDRRSAPTLYDWNVTYLCNSEV